MARKVTVGVETSVEKSVKPVQRLCNEIQLFDLCVLEKCNHKNGLFCTSSELLNSFEAVSEEDECPSGAGIIFDDLDDEEATDDCYDDAFNDDQFDDEGYEEDQEVE